MDAALACLALAEGAPGPTSKNRKLICKHARLCRKQSESAMVQSDDALVQRAQVKEFNERVAVRQCEVYRGPGESAKFVGKGAGRGKYRQWLPAAIQRLAFDLPPSVSPKELGRIFNAAPNHCGDLRKMVAQELCTRQADRVD